MPRLHFAKTLRTPALAIVVLLCEAMGLRAEDDVLFRREVMAVISKAGCNAGACHGNATGKGGFKLSLRGQDPDLDWQALTRDQAGRRVNLLQPENSLILLKASASLAHEGGQRFTTDSPEYAILLRWLRDGALDSGINAPKLTKLDVKLPQRVVIEPAKDVKLHVTARFADGSERDVTRFAVYDPTNQVAKVSVDGDVTRDKAGETTILVRYLSKQVAVPIAFIPARPDFVWSNAPTNNYLDEQVFKKLRELRMNPSELCSDALFVRRAYLDLLGFVPSAEAAHGFIADPAPDKRAKLIDTLLERPELADFWALKWADLLKIEQRQLDYDGMKVFHDWIRESIAKNKPLDKFASEIIAARGSTLKNPPANWWRANRDPETRAENTARVFLGTQLKCAQCHNHPFERWTQDDYYNWAGLFARIDYKVSDDKRGDKNDKNEFKGDQTVLIKSKATYLNVRTGDPAKPRFLGVTEVPQVSKDRDELLALADWLPHSSMFARMQVNRVWFNLLGRGIVDPVDDFRASNPPAHPELLDALAKDFATHGYDLRWLIRTITASRVYQLSDVPNATNAEDEDNNSHAIVRRLSAEQMLDSLSAVLAIFPSVFLRVPSVAARRFPEACMASAALVVEDDPDTGLLLVQLLHERGFPATLLQAGKTALAWAQQHKPALVLLDLMLPDVDGVEVCRELKLDRATNLIPIVMVTARAQDADRIRGLEVGANYYLTKPFTDNQLDAAVAQVLAWREELERHGTAGEIDFRLRSDTHYLEELNHLLASLLLHTSLTERQARHLMLAVRELGSNAIEWGHQNKSERIVTVTYRIEAAKVAIIIRDTGPGFDRSNLPHAARRDDPLSHLEIRESLGLRDGGLGILMAEGLVDELRYNETGNEVRLVKHFAACQDSGSALECVT